MKKVLVLLGVTIILASCSGGGGSGVSGLDKLPRMTSPVILASGASSSSVKVSAATTGLTFWGTPTFAHGDSRAMCEMFNLSRDSLNKAAAGDKTLCYMQTTVLSDANKGTMTSSGLDMYDGKDHILTLSFVSGSPNGSLNLAPKMKFKIVKDGDKIKEFKMFMCMGGSTATPTQTEYLHQIIEGENVTIVSKNSEVDPMGGTWKGNFEATGKINGEGQFTEKEITAHTDWTKDTSNYNYQNVTFNQYADRLKLVGGQVGKCGSCGSGASEYVNNMYAEMQLLNGTNTDIHQLAIGDGSAKYSFSMGMSGTSNESWLGNTKKAVTPWTSGDYYSAVNAGALPAANAAGISGTGFAADEIWDCSGTSEATMIVDQDAIEASCSNVMLVPDNGNNWIDCWTDTNVPI